MVTAPGVTMSVQKHERDFPCGLEEQLITFFHSPCGRVPTGPAMSIDIAKGGHIQSIVHSWTRIKTPGRSPFMCAHCGKIFVRVPDQGGGGSAALDPVTALAEPVITSWPVPAARGLDSVIPECLPDSESFP
jgi:hypothetical protein